MANLEKYKDAARKHELKENWPKAIEVLVKAIEEFEKAPDNEADLALYNKVGDLYVKVNDTTNAIQFYERAVDLYSEASLVNPAIALCNKVLRLSPGRASTYLKLGMLFAKKGFAAEAKQNLLEYADRMMKAGQLEEAFKALKKFAEMTPGQEEIWTVLAQQARAQAKSPEAKDQVERLIGEFEAKDKAGAQRRSRASRSMVTGEEIKEEPGPKKGELIFLDVGDMPTPGRKSGAVRTGSFKPVPPAPPPPPAPVKEPEPPPRVSAEKPAPRVSAEKPAPRISAEKPAPPPPPRVSAEKPAPPAPKEPGWASAPIKARPPEPEPEPLAIETTSLADDEPASPVADLPLIDVEPSAPVAGLERTSMGGGSAPTIEPMPLIVEPTSFEPSPADMPGVREEPEAPPAAGLDLGEIEIPPADLERARASSKQDLPMIDLGEPTSDAAVAEPPPVARRSAAKSEPTFQVQLPQEPELPSEEAPSESEVAQSIEFQDMGEVEEPTTPSLKDLAKRVARNPEDWGARRLHGEALIEAGEREKGLAELDASLAGYDGADDLATAGSLVEEILRLEPNSVRHQQKRVELAYRSGDRARLVDAYVELADALLRSNEPDKSVAVYQRVLEHDPDNVRARSAIETLAPAPPPAAEPVAPAARKAAPEVPAAPVPVAGGDYVDLGAMLLDEDAPKDTRMRIEDEEPTGDEQKDFQNMLAAFKKGIDANVGDEDFQSHFDLGVAYKEMGLLDEAIAEFQKALRAPEGKLKSSEALGLCFFEKGQFTVAETILKRGLDNPSHGDAERVGLLYWLGRTQEESGKEKDALESYNRVFAVDINFQDVNQRVAALSSSRSEVVTFQAAGITLADVQRPVMAQLDQVTAALRDIVAADFPLIQEVNGHLLQMKGKMFRPTLLLLANAASGARDSRAVRLGAVIELIHLATLVHDDSVDHSALRRGMPTVNALFSHQISVIMGDYLYSRAIIELVRLDDLEPLRVLSRVTNEMTVGEMRQLAQYDALAFREEDYEVTIRSKTATLLAAACESGALRAEPDRRQALRAFGDALGMAFQIADDLLDYTGAETVTGKPSGNDLREHKVTLPLIAALPRFSAAQREAVRRLFETPEPADELVAEVVSLVETHGGLAYARERASHYASRAEAALEALPPSAARDALLGAIAYAVERRK